MARIHSHRHGKAHSTRPSSKRTPNWITLSQEQITANIAKLSKEGLGPSQIGMRLRDEDAIPLVKTVMGKGIKEIMSESKIAAPIPEDLGRLVDRASRLKLHLNNHHADRKNVRSLELLEAKIHRLSNYYKRNGEIQESWKYSAAVAQLA